MQINELACHIFSDADRRRKTPELEKVDVISQGPGSSMSIIMYVSASLASQILQGEVEASKGMLHI